MVRAKTSQLVASASSRTTTSPPRVCLPGRFKTRPPRGWVKIPSRPTRTPADWFRSADREPHRDAVGLGRVAGAVGLQDDPGHVLAGPAVEAAEAGRTDRQDVVVGGA